MLLYLKFSFLQTIFCYWAGKVSIAIQLKKRLELLTLVLIQKLRLFTYIDNFKKIPITLSLFQSSDDSYYDSKWST